MEAGIDRRGAAATAETRRPKAGATAGTEASPEDGRGRSATTPSEIRARGWKDVLLRVCQGINDDRILANAAAVTFYALLALFPAIAVVVSIYGSFADPASIAKDLDTAKGILPSGGIDVIRDQLTRLSAHGRGTLGIGFVVGFVISLWSANGGVKALFDALNVIYEEKEKRSFIRLNVISLLFTLGLIGFLIVALVGVVAIPVALEHLPGAIGTIFNVARWPVMLVLLALVLSLVYRHGPSRNEPRWRWVSWGGMFAAVAWLAASALFSWYAANFGSFNKTYGSLGAVIGFMTWMWVSIIVILAGAKVNAEAEHQTARESTEGPEEPLGARGAKMADTVGPARAE
jgi:membrane protein